MSSEFIDVGYEDELEYGAFTDDYDDDDYFDYEETYYSGNRSGNKKPRKRLKRWQIVLISCATVFAVLGGIVAYFVISLLNTPPGVVEGVDMTQLIVDMDDQYYVGTENSIDLALAFPDNIIGALVGGSSSVSGTMLTVSGLTPFTLEVGGIVKNVTVVDGGVNVATYEDLYNTINVEKKPVVVQVPELTMVQKKSDDGERISTLNLEADAYGNGVSINAHDVVKSTDDGKFTWGVIGETAFNINPEIDNKVLMRDFHVYGKTIVEEDTVRTYNNYGSILNLGTQDWEDETNINAEVIHNVFEKSGKVVHILGSNVLFEGNIVRDAADTAISIGSFPNKGSDIIMRNNVIANSLTGGILFYCFAQSMNKENAATAWNKLKIEGFLDIYNWKDQNGLVFLPDTEARSLGMGVVNMVNGIVSGTIPDKDYDDMKAIFQGDVKDETGAVMGKGTVKMIHFGILRIITVGGVGKNGSTIIGFEDQGYKGDDLPVPTVAEFVIKEVFVVGYYSNAEGSVKPTDTISTNANLYKELRDGRIA